MSSVELSKWCRAYLSSLINRPWSTQAYCSSLILNDFACYVLTIVNQVVRISAVHNSSSMQLMSLVFLKRLRFKVQLSLEILLINVLWCRPIVAYAYMYIFSAPQKVTFGTPAKHRRYIKSSPQSPSFCVCFGARLKFGEVYLVTGRCSEQDLQIELGQTSCPKVP